MRSTNRVPSRWSSSCCSTRASSVSPSDGDLGALAIVALDDHPGRARHPRREARQAEAALLFPLGASLLDDAGVDHRDEIVDGPTGRGIGDEHAEPDADLGRSQTDAGGGMHGLDHVVDQRLQIVVEVDHLPRGAVQGVGAMPKDGADQPDCPSESALRSSRAPSSRSTSALLPAGYRLGS